MSVTVVPHNAQLVLETSELPTSGTIDPEKRKVPTPDVGAGTIFRDWGRRGDAGGVAARDHRLAAADLAARRALRASRT